MKHIFQLERLRHGTGTGIRVYYKDGLVIREKTLKLEEYVL